jgi:hypothetical protein
MSGPWEAIVDNHQAYLVMRLKIEAVFEPLCRAVGILQTANIVQRFAMEDAFYRLTIGIVGEDYRAV